MSLLAMAPAGAEPTARTGRHVRVVANLSQSRALDAAVQVADAAWSAVCAAWGIAPTESPRPPTLHLLSTRESFDATLSRLNADAPRELLAFTHPPTHTAYLVIQPDASDAILRRIGLPRLTSILIAHETAHLVAAELVPRHADLPEWLAEGLATVAAEHVLPVMDGAVPHREPFFSTMMVRAQRLAKNGSLPAVHRLLLDDLRGIDRHGRYAVQWSFVRFLMQFEERRGWNAIARAARDAPEAASMQRSLADALAAAIAPKSPDDLDRAWRRSIDAMTPEWDEAVRSLHTARGGWIQSAFADAHAAAWRTQPAGRPPYSIVGRYEFHGLRFQSLNVLLDRRADGYLYVSFTQNHGASALRYHAADDRWERLGSQWSPHRERRDGRFRIDVEADRLRVELHGKQLLEIPIRDRTMDGPWGLGAKAGTTGAWRGVRLLRGRASGLFPLDLGNLHDAALVTAALESGRQPRVDDPLHERIADEVRRQAQHVRVVVPPGHHGRQLIVAQRRAHALDLVRRDRHADARPAEQDPEICRSIGDGLRRRIGRVGVVARFGILGAEVVDLVLLGCEERLDLLLGGESAMIGAERDFHIGISSRRRANAASIWSAHAR